MISVVTQRGTLVVGIAYGCPYYMGPAIFYLFFQSTTSEKSFIPYKASATVQAIEVCPAVQFGQESCPAGEYLHSERLWMLEKVSAALNTTPTTIPQTPHISKNPQKKKKKASFWSNFITNHAILVKVNICCNNIENVYTLVWCCSIWQKLMTY